MKMIQLSNRIEMQTFLEDFYEAISYDGSPEFKDYVPTGIWISLFEGEGSVYNLAGFINLEPLNNVTWIAHIMIYETFRGNGSEEWAIQAAEYMRGKLGAKKFLAITPYKAAKQYAERAGFTYLTMLSKSIKKNGELMDQYLLELSGGDL